MVRIPSRLASIVLFLARARRTEGVEEMGKRILVVEDDRQVRDFVAAALESARRAFEIVKASNGREASERLVAGKFDLVLTDLNMPVVNGIELVREIRTRYPDLPIVLMSGASAEWRSELEREGFDDLPLLMKPVSVAQLVEVVTGVLGL